MARDWAKTDPSQTVLGMLQTTRATAMISGADGRERFSARDLVRLTEETRLRANALGLPDGGRIAIVAADPMRAACGFLALSAVGTVAPLNPKLAKSQFQTLLKALSPAALVIDAGLDTPARAAALICETPVLELDGPSSANGARLEITGPELGPPTALRTPLPKDPALILHTSGTTGAPKRVVFEHRQLRLGAANVAEAMALSAEDASVNVMPLFHIHGLVAGLLAPLSVGAQVAVAPGFDAARFFETADAIGATWHTAAPTLLAEMARTARTRLGEDRRTRFRAIRSSSSPLPERLRQEIETVFNCPVVEAYGMTEATHQIASQRLDGARRPGSVGKAVGVATAVLPSAPSAATPTAPQPTGEGELVVRGPTISGVDGAALDPEGWFRTGDLGRIEADGEIFLLSRIKDVIKRGGHQIAPPAVEDALLALDGVDGATVFGVAHPTLGEDLVGAVVPRPGATPDADALRQALFDRLAPHQVPSRVLIVDAIPMTATGKVQRQTLAEAFAPALATPEDAPEDATEKAPASAFEALLAELFSETLGARAGRRDNFFLLGGDSLSGARLMTQLSELLGVELSDQLLFEAPSPAQLADQLLRADPAIADLIEASLEEI